MSLRVTVLTVSEEEEVRPVPCEIEGWPESFIDAGGEVGSDVGFVFCVLWEEWEISGFVALHEEQIVISELSIKANPNCPLPPGGIRTSTLKFPLGRIRSDIQRTLAHNLEGWVRESQHKLDILRKENEALQAVEAALASSPEKVRLGRKPYSDDDLRVIARIYLDFQHRHGVHRIVERMASTLDLNISTLNKKIRRATLAGFLGPAQQGRGGRMPGPRLAHLYSWDSISTDRVGSAK